MFILFLLVQDIISILRGLETLVVTDIFSEPIVWGIKLITADAGAWIENLIHHLLLKFELFIVNNRSTKIKETRFLLVWCCLNLPCQRMADHLRWVVKTLSSHESGASHPRSTSPSPRCKRDFLKLNKVPLNLKRETNAITSENCLLNYFDEYTATYLPSTAWSRYLMLKKKIQIRENIDI